MNSLIFECLQIGATSNDAFVIVYYNQVVGAEDSSRRAAGILMIFSVLAIKKNKSNSLSRDFVGEYSSASVR